MDLEPVSVRYVVVVTAGPLCSQTHDRGLWGRITEPGVVLTPTAVSRVGIKIWHPWRSNTDTSWAWSQRKCLSPPYINTASLSSTAMTLTPSADNSLFCISLFQALSLHRHFSPSSASTSASSFLNPFSPICSVSSHLQNLSSDTHHWFSANFSSPLEHQFLWHSSSWLLWWLHMPLLGLVVVNWSRERELSRVTSAVFATVG